MYGGLSLHAERDGKTLIVRASGLFTLQTAAYLRQFTASRVRRSRAGAVLLDMTRCLYVMADDDWRTLAAQTAAEATTSIVPIALLVAPPHEEQCERYCRMAARHGLSRMAYVTFYEAWDWTLDAQEWPASAPAPLS